jgi:hypothetical protein
MHATKSEATARISRQPAWYHTYFLAMVENDRDKALLEIAHAHRAIQERLLELRRAPGEDLREMQDLASAITYLGILLMHIGNESGDLLWD